jgi:pimeloyl-ACP methyl ester carboxylesterase
VLDRLAFEHPGVVDTAAGGLDGYLRGLARQPAFAVVLAVGAARSGTPWPPADEQSAVRILGGVGGLVGGLDEDRTWGRGGFGGLEVRVGEELEKAGPTGLSGLMVDEVDLGRDEDECRVRVVEVPQPDGSSAWILELPGTQAWDPRPAANPFDLTTDVEAMAGEATMAAAGAAGVLATAQSRRGRFGAGDPVMLVGHSQGGILAASLASDPQFRAAQRVTDVVTFGAPVSHFPVPAGVHVLSVEHRQDPVPRLDGGRNPDRAGWVTVERDLSRAVGRPSAALTHRATEYLDTAQLIDGRLADGTADPSLRDWAANTSEFFGPDARVTDAHLTRLPRPTQ